MGRAPMKLASPAAAIAGLLVAGLFTARAMTGVPAAWADRAGRKLEDAGRFADAGRLLDRGARGANRVEGLWRAGRTWLERWDAMTDAQRAGTLGAAALGEAAERFLAGRIASPGSAWFTAAMGDVYARREAGSRPARVLDLSVLASGPWAVLGDDGRIGVGLARRAIAREPNSYGMRDQLVLLLEANGLHDDATAAMVESARVLPDFLAHPSFSFESLPRDLIETFWKTARALPAADYPLLDRPLWLVSSAKVGRRLGHHEEAEQDLRAAIAMPGTKLARAEEAYFLALVLIDRGRPQEAEPYLARASTVAGFGFAVAEARAHVAANDGRWTDALDFLREARRLRPRDLPTLLEFSRVAGKAGFWDQAEEALRWARLVAPADPAASRALVELLVARGERVRARGALDEYVRSFGRTEDAVSLERALAGPLDPPRP